MRMSQDRIAWVVFDDDGAHAVADDAALIRSAQAEGVDKISAWRAETAERTMELCTAVREGTRWRFTQWNEGGDFHWDAPADPSDDPRVLGIVERIETAAQVVATPVRWTAAEWPPPDLHADADPNRIGQRLGSVLDNGVGDGGAVVSYWHYCPERIARVVDELDDSRLDQIMDYLEGRMAMTLVHAKADPVERERLIDQTYLEPNPTLQDVLTALLLRAMDMEL